MIPKLIHYSWFSGEPYPKHIEALMQTWNKVLPEYQFVLWNMPKLTAINNTFANEAISVRKWAFAADFIRLYAVYEYGGIWLDTDIEMLKSFNPFLNNEVFIGREANFHHRPRERWLTSHCFGAVAHHPFIKDCLDYYQERHFIRSSNKKFPQYLRFDMTIIPEVQAEIAKTYGYDSYGKRDDEQMLNDGIHIYPSDYFDNPQYSSMDNVVCIHRASGAWRPGCNGIPDYSITNRKRKGFKYLGHKINDFLEDFGLAILKFKSPHKRIE